MCHITGAQLCIGCLTANQWLGALGAVVWYVATDLGVVSNVADAPVHVASGAKHDICQPLVHLVMAMNQFMRHHKS